MKTASIKKLKLNVTNIKSTLLKGNKKLIKIQGSNRKIMDADLDKKNYQIKKRKLKLLLYLNLNQLERKYLKKQEVCSLESLRFWG